MSDPLKYRPTQRPFGIEIEITVPDYHAKGDSEFWGQNYCNGAGASALKQGHPDWDYGTDCCAEIRSPVLHGAEGMHELESMYADLVKVGAKAQKCCGAHTHYSADDLTPADKARVANAWAVNELLINTFVDKSRHNNGMCSAINRSAGQFTAENLPYKGQSLNCRSHHGTIEVRKHHATLDFSEMEAWIRFCQAFIHNAITGDRLHTCAPDAKILLDRVRPVEKAHERLLQKCS